MVKERLHKISDSLFNCLLLIRYNIFNEQSIIKSFSENPKEVDKYLKICPLPTSHIKVILYLQNCKSPSISQIANNLNISKSNMSPIINNLVDLELISTYPDINDKRIMRVQLTDKAHKVFNIFYKASKDSIYKKISALSDKDISILENSLSDLNCIFNKLSKN